MWLIVDQSLAAGFIPINTWQQGVSRCAGNEVMVYNNDNKTFFSILTFAMPSFDNVLQLSLSHSGLASIYIRKRKFYPLNVESFSA